MASDDFDGAGVDMVWIRDERGKGSKAKEGKSSLG